MDEIDYLLEQDFPYSEDVYFDGGEIQEEEIDESDSLYVPMASLAVATAAVATSTYVNGTQDVIGDLSGEFTGLILGGAAIASDGIAIADYLER